MRYAAARSDRCGRRNAPRRCEAPRSSGTPEVNISDGSARRGRVAVNTGRRERTSGPRNDGSSSSMRNSLAIRGASVLSSTSAGSFELCSRPSGGSFIAPSRSRIDESSRPRSRLRGRSLTSKGTSGSRTAELTKLADQLERGGRWQSQATVVTVDAWCCSTWTAPAIHAGGADSAPRSPSVYARYSLAAPTRGPCSSRPSNGVVVAKAMFTPVTICECGLRWRAVEGPPWIRKVDDAG